MVVRCQSIPLVHHHDMTVTEVRTVGPSEEGVRLPALAIAVISAGFAGYSMGITVSVLPSDSDLTNFWHCVVVCIVYTAI